MFMFGSNIPDLPGFNFWEIGRLIGGKQRCNQGCLRDEFTRLYHVRLSDKG